MFADGRHIASLTVALALAAGAMANSWQADSLTWLDMSQLRQEEAWLYSENAAGLPALPMSSLSEMTLSLDKRNGKFVNYGGSDNSFEVGAQAESYSRINRRVVAYGKVDYRRFTGRHMAGSYFIDPEHAPFDLVESSDTNRGTKKLETYHLAGAVGIDLGRRWSVGTRLDYTAANYAKQKDLRHVNNLMDMYLTVGVVWQPVAWLEVGADYYYRRRTEGLTFDVYGTTDQVYNSLVSYGAFFGKTEQFGENGYTKENEEKPLFDRYHGGTIQLKWHVRPHVLSLFVEGGYKSRSGYYGKKSPGTVVYSGHGSDIWQLYAVLLWRQGDNRHTLHASWRQEKLDNHENIYREDNEGGGMSNVNYYGTLDTTVKTLHSMGVAYTGSFMLEDGCPLWMLRAGVSAYGRELTASVYPFYRRQKLDCTEVDVAGQYNLMKKRNVFSFRIDGGYVGGSGAPFADGTYVPVSADQAVPDGMETYLYREYEFVTCQRLKAAVTLGYNRALGPKGLKGYASLRYGLVKAFGTEYVEGDMRHRLTCTVGCRF